MKTAPARWYRDPLPPFLGWPRCHMCEMSFWHADHSKWTIVCVGSVQSYFCPTCWPVVYKASEE